MPGSRPGVTSAVALVLLALVATPVVPDSARVRAQSSAKSAKTPDASAPFQTVWPLPPEPPRIRYVAQYATSTDVEGPPQKSTNFRIREALLGRERVAGELPVAARFARPYGIAVDSQGRIIVADTERAAVFILDLAGKRFLELGRDDRQVRMRIPISVAVDAQDNIYIGDNGQGGIFVFGADLKFRAMLTRQGQVDAPTALAVDVDAGRLYAVDTKRHALLAFDLASKNLIRQIGSKGDKPGEFGWPSGVAVGPAGRVYVSDTMNYRVQIFDRELKFVRSFGSVGMSPGQFRRPKGIAVDPDGIIYVVDSDFNNFQMFDAEGRVLLYVGAYGPRPGQMMMPAGIAIPHGQRRIYVTEQINRRVQVFERTSPDLR